MTIKHLYPATRPSLDLNFAATKRLDPRITFSRASTGTYVDANGVIQPAATNTARFDHNPTTGESLGLLVEEARTNLLTYSQEFDTAAWTKNGATCTANAAVAPDGTTTADKIIINNGSSAGDVRRTGLATNGVVSFYAKPAGFDFIGGEAHTAAGGYPKYRVNLLTGECSAESGLSISTQSVGNGWLRISIVGNYGNNAFQIAPRNDYVFGNGSIAGADGVKGAFLWGAQLEAGSFPTSYIPTTASQVTRSADVAQITGTNFSSWWNASQFTLLADIRIRYYLAGYGYSGPAFGFGSSAPRINFGTSEAAGRPIAAQIYDGTTNHVNRTGAYEDLAINSSLKLALSFNGSSSSGTYNSRAISQVTTAAVNLSGIASLKIGEYADTPTKLNGTISRLTYYPVRLPDATLQALTR